MLMAENLGVVERERERESILLKKENNFVCFCYAYGKNALINILEKIKIRKNKDPCYGLRLLYLRI